jgi:nitroimidazol reductase NimA-like FMN-containing flavoprotein (pyridoxamine 5'-phosphate oxidase superfamily)
MIEPVEFDQNGLEILERSECMHLLARTAIGRIAVSSGALPVILPVNFLLDDDRILIRTSAGTKLAAALANAVVAFEIDDVDTFSHTGWSVAVTGFAREITGPDDLARIRALPLAHWAPTDGHVIAVSTDVISGRRIRRDAQRASAN